MGTVPAVKAQLVKALEAHAKAHRRAVEEARKARRAALEAQQSSAPPVTPDDIGSNYG